MVSSSIAVVLPTLRVLPSVKAQRVPKLGTAILRPMYHGRSSMRIPRAEGDKEETSSKPESVTAEVEEVASEVKEVASEVKDAEAPAAEAPAAEVTEPAAPKAQSPPPADGLKPLERKPLSQDMKDQMQKEYIGLGGAENAKMGTNWFLIISVVIAVLALATYLTGNL